MAMNGDTLGMAIKAAVEAAAAADPADRDEIFKAMGNAIVQHIQAAAQVVVVVTSGPGSPGGGTGTIT